MQGFDRKCQDMMMQGFDSKCQDMMMLGFDRKCQDMSGYDCKSRDVSLHQTMMEIPAFERRCQLMTEHEIIPILTATARWPIRKCRMEQMSED